MHWIGENAVQKTLTPTLAVAGLYSAEDCVGALMTIDNSCLRRGGGGVIRMIRLLDKASQIHTHGLELTFFRTAAPSSTFTDNGAFTINAADMGDVLGGVVFGAGADRHLTKAAGVQFITLCNLNLYYGISGAETMYCALKTTGTPTWADGDLSLMIWMGRF